MCIRDRASIEVRNFAARNRLWYKRGEPDFSAQSNGGSSPKGTRSNQLEATCLYGIQVCKIRSVRYEGVASLSMGEV